MALMVVLASFTSVAAHPDLAWPDRTSDPRLAAADTPFSAVPGPIETAPDTTAVATETSTSTTPPTTATAPQREIRSVQSRLAELGYDIGPIDGLAGGRTAHTIMAFQKVEGLKRTGRDSPELRAALDAATTPAAMVPGGAPTRIEVDLNRQVLFHWKNGSLARILSVSTGNGEHYCVKGDCDVAVTPPGSFRIGRKAAGLEVAPLGELWWPMYFNGGIAIHGSPSVPGYPASHGCVRIPMYAAPILFEQVGRGTPVILVGQGPGPAGARVVPPPEPPPDPHPVAVPPPDEVPATTSTVPSDDAGDPNEDPDQGTEPTTTTTTTTTTTPQPATTTTSTTLAFPPNLDWAGD